MEILKIIFYKKRCFTAIFLLTISLAVFIYPVLAMGNESSRAAGNSIAAAEKALDSLKNAYLEKNLEAFFSGVSEQAYFNEADLKISFAKKFSEFNVIDIRIFEDNSLRENDKVDLKTHWQKRSVRNSTGKIEVTQGKAEFIFDVKENTELLNIRGDSPF